MYEYISGAFGDVPANAEKLARLRERGLLTADGAVNAVVVQGEMEAFFSSLPVLRDDLKKTFADFALERAEMEARDYPPQMRDLVVSWSVSRFIGGMTALLVLDALYADGAFRPLTEAERAAFGLLVFSDKCCRGRKARGADTATYQPRAGTGTAISLCRSVLFMGFIDNTPLVSFDGV